MDTNTDQHGNISTSINLNTQPGAFPERISLIKFDLVANGEYQCRIDDSLGVALAILVGHLDLDPTQPDAFDFTVRERVVLPVRPNPQPDPDADPHAKPIEYPVPDTTSPTATLSANYGSLSHPHSITHGHVHSHPTSPLAQPTFYDHTHRHTHYGDYAHRANAFGHSNDSHGDHAH